MVAKGIGERLREIRRAHGMSMRALAALTDLSPTSIANLENAKTQPRTDTLCRIASALEVDLRDLVGEIDQKQVRVVGFAEDAPEALIALLADHPNLDPLLKAMLERDWLREKWKPNSLFQRNDRKTWEDLLNSHRDDSESYDLYRFITGLNSIGFLDGTPDEAQRALAFIHSIVRNAYEALRATHDTDLPSFEEVQKTIID